MKTQFPQTFGSATEPESNLQIQKNLYFRKAAKSLFLFMLFNIIIVSSTFAASLEISIDQKARAIVAPQAENYTWYYNGQKLENRNTQALHITESGRYLVETTNASGQVVRYETQVVVTDTSIRKVHIIGDSTVMTYSASWYPWGGWGAFLPYFFDTTLHTELGKQSLQFQNHAVGGRSSKSFYDEGKWAQVLAVLLPGDTYIIQFGHNDRDWTNAARYADTTTYKSYLKKYIDEGRLKGANPILVTPMNMNTWFCDEMRNVFREGANNYRGAMINLGKEMNVPVIDLEAKSDSLFEMLGRDYTTHYLFNNLQPGEYPNYPNGYSDFTHFQEMGAIEMAKLVLEGIKEHAAEPAAAMMLPYLVPEHKVTVTSKTPDGGVVTRTNTFPKGLNVTLKGIANPTHKFGSWTDENGAKITDYKMFTFVMDSVDRSFTVDFEEADVLPLQAGNYRFYNAGSLDKTKQWMEVYNNSGSNGAAIVQNPGTGRSNPQWTIKHIGNGYYTILAAHSGKAMDVSGRSLADGARVVQYTPNAASLNQQFKLVKISGNTYHLVARHSGKYLQFASDNCGANLVQATYDPNNTNQQFVLELVSLSQPAIARASNPTPADVAPVVAPENITLLWSGDAQTYDVYMGTSAEALTLKASGLTGNSFKLDTTAALGTHFWRVDAFRDGQSEIGDTWSFTVKDTVAPVVITKDFAVTLANGIATITGQDVDNGSNDAYGIASLEVSPNQFDCSNIGINQVILTVTDTNGNVSSATAAVTVKGTIPAPSISVSKTDNTYTGVDTHTIVLGYGAQNVTLSATGGVTYQWNNGSLLDNDKIAAPVFSPTAAGVYELVVTATNEFGCTATSSVNINVIDARCGTDKVLVCHSGQAICISKSDVQSHLAHGCKLGSCTNSTATSETVASQKSGETETKLQTYPNPVYGQASISVAILEAGTYNVELYNLQGRLIKTVASGNSEGNTVETFHLDATGYAEGVYLVKLRTDKQVITQRIVIKR